MLWSSPVCLVCNGHCTLVAFLRIGADENRAAIFDVQHKSISLPKVSIQQNFALKCNPAELLCGVGHLNGAKALQVAANSGGVGDDKGVLPSGSESSSSWMQSAIRALTSRKDSPSGF